MAEPFDSAEVIRVASALWNRHVFADWRATNESRRELLYHLGVMNIPGIWTRLEDVRTDLEVHSSRFVNRLDSANLRIHVSARSNKQAAVSAAQKGQNFLYAVHNDFRRMRTNGVDAPHRGAIDQAVNYGMGVRRLDFNPETREELFTGDFAEEGALRAAIQKLYADGFQGNPFMVENPDLFACAWEEDFSVICEVGVRAYSVADLDRAAQGREVLDYITSATRSDEAVNWGSPTASYGGELTVKVYHLETASFIYDVISVSGADGGYMTQCRPNLIGRPWYAFCPGRKTSERTPNEAYRPLIAPLYPIVQELWVLGTLLNSGAFQTGRPIYQEVPVNGKAVNNLLDWMQSPEKERPVLRFDIVNDAVIKPRPGHQLVPLAVPDQRWLISAYEQKKAELNQYGFPSPLSPDPQEHSEASSGYQAAIGVEQATLYVEPALRNLAAADMELSLLVMDIIQALDIPVTIPVHPVAQGLGTEYTEPVTIQPSDLRDLDISVALDAKPATAEYAEKEADTRAIQSKLMSKQTYMTKHYANPMQEMERIKLEEGAEQVDALALQQALRIITENAQYIADDEAAQLGVARVGQTPSVGGAAPGQLYRNARPPNGASPGLGAPQIPPQQTEPGQPVPLGQGQGMQGVAP